VQHDLHGGVRRQAGVVENHENNVNDAVVFAWARQID
jgi:hypothetical protein